jgi:MYXO-CTERM domain-containing protein
MAVKLNWRHVMARSTNPGICSLLSPALALGVTAMASAGWDGGPPPPYTLPLAPTVARFGTLSAIADNSNQMNVYGPAVGFSRGTGVSYAGIGTTVLGTTLTPGTSTTTPILGSARPQFGSSAWIRAGQASASTTVNMAWRTATQFETYGSSTSIDMPGGGPMPDSGPWNTLGSDVLELSGIAATGSLDGQGRLPTDAYALEMTFDPNIIVAGYQNYSTWGWDIQDIINARELQISYFDPITGVWQKNINVINPGVSRVENFIGDYASFAVAYGVTDANLSSFVGSYGVSYNASNPTESLVWAVLDHTSMYAVAPTPGAVALLGLAGLVGRRRKA